MFKLYRYVGAEVNFICTEAMLEVEGAYLACVTDPTTTRYNSTYLINERYAASGAIKNGCIVRTIPLSDKYYQFKVLSNEDRSLGNTSVIVFSGCKPNTVIGKLEVYSVLEAIPG